MTNGEEFRAYMKATNRDQINQNEPHPTQERLIAYHRGELSEAERETIQAHLVACAECIALFRSLNDFLEPARADEEDVSEAETNEQWQALRERVQLSSPASSTQTGTTVVPGDFKQSRDKKLSWLTLAMAASLVVSLGLAGWSVWQERQARRQSQETATELQRKQQELEQRLAQLTETGADEVKREREARVAAEAEIDRLQDLLAAAQPEAPPRVYAFTLSSDRGSAQELQLKLNTAAQLRLLISKPDAFREYEIELLDQGGRVVRKFQNVRPRGVDRALSVRLNRGALSPGKYRLRLLGVQDKASTSLGEFTLTVTGPTEDR